MRAYELDDPRPIAVGAPYTYFLPTERRLAAVAPGDVVQLLFRSLDPSAKYAVERMWVCVQMADGDNLAGELESKPYDMPGITQGERVLFKRHHIISIEFVTEEKRRALSEEPRREYWDRCMVDRCVLYDGVQVGYLYREAPGLQRDNDKYPDSGWRIRGDARGCSDEEIDSRKAEYVALGAVLNRDDSWLSLIDEPEGSAFRRDFFTSTYRKATDE